MSKKKKLIIAIIGAVVLVAAIVLAVFIIRRNTKGDPMIISNVEGTVTVTKKNGKKITAGQSTKLDDIVEVTSDSDSYAWIMLDEHKMVKLDSLSDVVIVRSGKTFDVYLASGNLCFDVSKKLEEDETLRFHTDDTISYVTGTFGVICTDDEQGTAIQVLEGSVDVYVVKSEPDGSDHPKIIDGEEDRLYPIPEIDRRESMIDRRKEEIKVTGTATAVNQNVSAISQQIVTVGAGSFTVINTSAAKTSVTNPNEIGGGGTFVVHFGEDSHLKAVPTFVAIEINYSENLKNRLGNDYAEIKKQRSIIDTYIDWEKQLEQDQKVRGNYTENDDIEHGSKEEAPKVEKPEEPKAKVEVEVEVEDPKTKVEDPKAEQPQQEQPKQEQPQQEQPKQEQPQQEQPKQEPPAEEPGDNPGEERKEEIREEPSEPPVEEQPVEPGMS